MDRLLQIHLSNSLIKIVALLLLSFSYPLVACEIEGDESSKEKEKTASASLPSYKLVWADLFDLPVLDVERWQYRTDCKAESCQRPENVDVAEGNLRILLKKEDYKNKPFTGGGIITKTPFSYGYCEVKQK